MCKEFKAKEQDQIITENSILKSKMCSFKLDDKKNMRERKLHRKI